MPSLWKRAGGNAAIHVLRARPFRVVESQHLIATRRLVDTHEEQRVLEDLLERAKPPLRKGTERLHYLLAAPFRYPPLPHGSRFGSAKERGIWYGSDSERTAFAETVYYRLVFLQGCAAPLGTLSLELSIFRAEVGTNRGVDLTRPPFDRYAKTLSSKTDYRGTQALAVDLRVARVEAVRFRSARDATGGTNIAVFDAAAFRTRKPTPPAAWTLTLTGHRAEVSKRDVFSRETHVFLRREFLVRGRLPVPQIGQ